MNSEKYIELITELYDLEDEDLKKLNESKPKMETLLKWFYWEDIKRKVQLYYTKKDSKNRPNVQQVVAMLESDTKIKQIEPELEELPIHRPLPTTNLWAISQTFDKLVQILVDAGVISDTDGTYHNTKGLIDPATDLPVLSPQQWIKLKVAAAVKERPDLFSKYENLTLLESFAIAIQNNLVKIKTRDWKKTAEQLPPEQKTWNLKKTRIEEPTEISQIIGLK